MVFIRDYIIDNQKVAKATQNPTMSSEIAKNRGKSRQNKPEENNFLLTMAILYLYERYLKAKLIGATFLNIYMSIGE